MEGVYHVFRNGQCFDEDQAKPHLILFAIHLEDGDVCLPVDLIAWRMLPNTLGLEETKEAEEHSAWGFDGLDDEPIVLGM